MHALATVVFNKNPSECATLLLSLCAATVLWYAPGQLLFHDSTPAGKGLPGARDLRPAVCVRLRCEVNQFWPYYAVAWAVLLGCEESRCDYASNKALGYAVRYGERQG